MRYENIVALILILLVLLAPLVKWAKDRWMGYSIRVRFKGVTHTIRGATLTELIKELVGITGLSDAGAKEIIRRYGIRQLGRQGAWKILAELAGMSLEEYLDLAGELLPSRIAAEAVRAKRAMDLDLSRKIFIPGKTRAH